MARSHKENKIADRNLLLSAVSKLSSSNLAIKVEALRSISTLSHVSSDRLLYIFDFLEDNEEIVRDETLKTLSYIGRGNIDLFNKIKETLAALTVSENPYYKSKLIWLKEQVEITL